MKKKKTRHDKWDKKEFGFVPGTRVKKRAVFIGINYENDPKHRLANSVADANLAAETLLTKINWHPSESKIITDHSFLKPTRDTIIDSLQWLVAGSVAGDVLFLHVSGHSEKLKRYAALIPLDFADNRTAVSSKVFYEILIKNLPPKVLLYVIFDTCHSGSMLRLPFVYYPDTGLFIQKPKLKIPQATVIMLSSCHKEQKATDANSLSQWVYDKLSNSEITWRRMINSIKQFRHNQTPIITTSKPLKLETNKAFTRLVSRRKLSWWKKLC